MTRTEGAPVCARCGVRGPQGSPIAARSMRVSASCSPSADPAASVTSENTAAMASPLELRNVWCRQVRQHWTEYLMPGKPPHPTRTAPWPRDADASSASACGKSRLCSRSGQWVLGARGAAGTRPRQVLLPLLCREVAPGEFAGHGSDVGGREIPVVGSAEEGAAVYPVPASAESGYVERGVREDGTDRGCSVHVQQLPTLQGADRRLVAVGGARDPVDDLAG